ncbi:adenosylcobinamide amidohydrolase [Euzebya sp.]|uniref:adenosylcobinamide amidohydrolase n=1 Tax=Euzebya sp. TaxID=1971409 RepID=UPI003518B2A2
MAHQRSRLIRATGDRVVLQLDPPRRCVASTIVGGGVGTVRSWLNLQVPLDYARTDPVDHLLAESDGLPGPVAATMTAAEVGDVVDVREGRAWVIATVGLSVPLAAAGDLPPWIGPAPQALGTINIAAVLDRPLTDAGLVNAVQTLTEAKAQALAACGIPALNHDGPATGTATDSVLVACAGPGDHGVHPREAAPSDFAGTATPIGHDLAVATHRCITEGVARWRRRHA